MFRNGILQRDMIRAVRWPTFQQLAIPVRAEALAQPSAWLTTYRWKIAAPSRGLTSLEVG